VTVDEAVWEAYTGLVLYEPSVTTQSQGYDRIGETRFYKSRGITSNNSYDLTILLSLIFSN